MIKLILIVLVALSSVTSYGYSVVAKASAYNATTVTYQEGLGTYTYNTLVTFYNTQGELITPSFTTSGNQIASKGFVWVWNGAQMYGWDSEFGGSNLRLNGKIFVYAVGECLEANAANAYSETTITW
jgi:hypothetical protein